MTDIVPMERVERIILVLRGQKVILDADLAVLYGGKRGDGCAILDSEALAAAAFRVV